MLRWSLPSSSQLGPLHSQVQTIKAMLFFFFMHSFGGIQGSVILGTPSCMIMNIQAPSLAVLSNNTSDTFSAASVLKFFSSSVQ